MPEHTVYSFVSSTNIVNLFQTGTTPLFFAAQGGYLDVVKYLLDHGAPVDSLSVVRK